MFKNRSGLFLPFALFIFVFPFLIIYMEENLSFFLFSFLMVVLIFNVYDVLLESSRSSIILMISRFKILYLYSYASLYFGLLSSFISNYSFFLVSAALPLLGFFKIPRSSLFFASAFKNKAAVSFVNCLAFFNLIDGFLVLSSFSPRSCSSVAVLFKQTVFDLRYLLSFV